MSRFVTCLLPVFIAGILSSEAVAHPRAVGVHVGFAHRPFVYGGHYCGHYWGRPYCYRPYYRGWSVGVGVAPAYYGGTYVSGYYGPPPVVVERPELRPEIEVAHWNDADLLEMALNKFAVTRGLDRADNRIVAEIVNKDYTDETGALAKVKFRVHWVECRITKYEDGEEVREEKHKSATVKLKFDEAGEFTAYDD